MQHSEAAAPRWELADIDSVKINPANPRTITPAKLEELANSIRQFPRMLEFRPVVIDETRTALGGNKRLEAARLAGLTRIPILHAADLSDDERREFIIRDNVAFGEWDWGILKAEWGDAPLSDWGLVEPPEEIQNREAKEDGYRVPEDIQTDIVRGDVFQIGPHRMMCGDSTEPRDVAVLMDGKIADMMVTDPPYNVDYEGGQESAMRIMNDHMGADVFAAFLLAFHKAYTPVIRAGGGVYIWHAHTESRAAMAAFTGSGLLLKQVLVWVKNSIVLGRQDYQWKHEPCLYGWKPGAAHYFTTERTHPTVIEDKVDFAKMSKAAMRAMLEDIHSEKTLTTVIHCDKPVRSDAHPKMKPVKLIAMQVKNSSRPGEIVVDGFLGSGTTMVASHQLGRICHGMELDPKFCQATLDRMRLLAPELTITKNGNPYDEQ